MSRNHQVAVLAVVFTVAASAVQSCGRPDVVSSSKTSPSHMTPSNSELRRPPFRRLSTDPIEPAVQLLGRLGTNQEFRADLAATYRQAGYNGAAHFFENSLRELKGQSLALTIAGDLGGWGGGERELAAEPAEVAQKAGDQILSGRYREAVDLTRSEIENNGSTLELAIEWAHATLSLAMEAPHDVTPEAREVAVRLFVTGIEENVPAPIGFTEKADGYSLLARYFLLSGDRISARTAAKIALSDLRGQEPSPWRTSSEQRMREIVEQTQ